MFCLWHFNWTTGITNHCLNHNVAIHYIKSILPVNKEQQNLTEIQIFNIQQQTENSFTHRYIQTEHPSQVFSHRCRKHTTTAQSGNKDPLCGMLSSSMIEASSEMDTRPRVAVRETASAANLQVCPLGKSQSDSCSVNSTMRHGGQPLDGQLHDPTLC